MSDTLKLAIHRLASSTAPTGTVTGTVGPYSVTLSSDGTNPVVTDIASETDIKAGRFDMTLLDQTTLAASNFWTPFDTDGSGTPMPELTAAWDCTDTAYLKAADGTSTPANGQEVLSIDSRISGGPRLVCTPSAALIGGFLRSDADAGFGGNRCLVPRTDWASNVPTEVRGYATDATIDMRAVMCLTAFATVSGNVFPSESCFFSDRANYDTRLFGEAASSQWYQPAFPGSAAYRANGQSAASTDPVLPMAPGSIFYTEKSTTLVDAEFTFGREKVDNGTERRTWGGPLSVILVFGSAPSALDIQRCEGWLAHTFGFAANLPAGHPFKSAAPTR